MTSEEAEGWKTGYEDGYRAGSGDVEDRVEEMLEELLPDMEYITDLSIQHQSKSQFIKMFMDKLQDTVST